MRQDVEQIINNTKIDETKLPEAIRIITGAASIMEECDYDTDLNAKEKLIVLQNELRELAGKENYDIEEVNKYWSYTSLETKAAEALMQEPFRAGLPEEALKELILEILRSGDNDKWLPKSRKVYDLDGNGERIRLASSRWKSHKQDTVD